MLVQLDQGYKAPKMGMFSNRRMWRFTKYVYEVIQMGGLKDLSCKEWVKSSKQNRGHAWHWVMNPTYRTAVQSDAQTKPKCRSILYLYTNLLHDAFENEMFEFTQVACAQHISKTTPYLVHIQILQVYLPKCLLGGEELYPAKKNLEPPKLIWTIGNQIYYHMYFFVFCRHVYTN